jgi:hypothetical protein
MYGSLYVCSPDEPSVEAKKNYRDVSDIEWEDWTHYMEWKFLNLSPLWTLYDNILEKFEDPIQRVQALVIETNLRDQFKVCSVVSLFLSHSEVFIRITYPEAGRCSLPLEIVRCIFAFACDVVIEENSDYERQGYLNNKEITGIFPRSLA